MSKYVVKFRELPMVGARPDRWKVMAARIGLRRKMAPTTRAGAERRAAWLRQNYDIYEFRVVPVGGRSRA